MVKVRQISRNVFIATLELPGGRKLQLVLVFDTTGSMFPCLLEVRECCDSLTAKLFDKLGNVEIAAMAVGDYCDKDKYVVLNTQLTTNSRVVSDFIKKVGPTGGGDREEAYELALHEGLGLKWDTDPDTVKLMVFIADDEPNVKGKFKYGVRVEHDWREKAREYARRGIQIAAVQCLGNRYANYFYEGLAEITGGYHLKLNQFSELEDLILGLCYAQESPEKFEQFTRVVESERPLSRAQYNNFQVIGKGRTGFSAEAGVRFAERADKLIPVPPGRFQVLPVTRVERVTNFIEGKGFVFVRGGVFYELTGSEVIQGDKKVVILDRITADMFTGDEVRRLIKAPPGEKLRINPKKMDKDFTSRYRIFVQSRSFTRNMDPGTEVLFMRYRSALSA